MPKIGLRMVKTAIAVFLCFVIKLFRGSGIPFYSAIAAVLCMQPELEDSKAKGKSRIIATLIGGFAGMILLFLFQRTLQEGQDVLRYTLISLMLIPLIYLTVWIKQPASSYLTCVVFMCVTVSHAGDSDPFFFALNRMIDTLIGILIALGVNAFHIPHRTQKHLLIEVPISYLLEKDGQLSTYTRIHLNRYLKEGLKLGITSSDRPSELLTKIKEIKGDVQYLLMDGTLSYDPKNNHCTALHEIPYAIWSRLYHEYQALGYQAFVTAVQDGLLYVHHEPYQSQIDEDFYHREYRKMGNCFINHELEVPAQYHQPVVMMQFLFPKDKVLALQTRLSTYLNDITWVSYDFPYDPSIKELRIYSQHMAQAEPFTQLLQANDSLRLEKIRFQGDVSSKQAIQAIKKAFYHRL